MNEITESFYVAGKRKWLTVVRKKNDKTWLRVEPFLVWFCLDPPHHLLMVLLVDVHPIHLEKKTSVSEKPFVRMSLCENVHMYIK